MRRAARAATEKPESTTSRALRLKAEKGDPQAVRAYIAWLDHEKAVAADEQHQSVETLTQEEGRELLATLIALRGEGRLVLPAPGETAPHSTYQGGEGDLLFQEGEEEGTADEEVEADAPTPAARDSGVRDDREPSVQTSTSQNGTA